MKKMMAIALAALMLLAIGCTGANKTDPAAEAQPTAAVNVPTEEPATEAPKTEPAIEVTDAPTAEATAEPTPEPSAEVTEAPTPEPEVDPTEASNPATDPAELIGTWVLCDGEGEEAQQAVAMMLAMGMEMEFVFNEGGTGTTTMTMYGETDTKDLTYTAETHQITVDGQSIDYRVENGMLYITMDGTGMIFKRK